MGSGRRILIGLLAPLLPLLLFLLAFDVGIMRTVGNAQSVKHILSDSGVYSSIVPNLLKQQESIATGYGAISTTDPTVEKVARQALPTKDVQANTEAAIDNLYAWLNGKVQQPDFQLRLKPDSNALASGLATQVQQKLSSLPTCTTPYTATTFDALNATCLPPGISPAVAAANLQQQVKNSDITAVSLSASDFKNSAGQSVFQDQLKSLPRDYRMAKALPAVLAVLALLTAGALILLRIDWRAGLRYVGISLLIVGVSMLVFAGLFNRVVNNKVIPSLNTDNQVAQSSLKRAATEVASSINGNYVRFGLIYGVLGAVAILVPRFITPAKNTAPTSPGSKKTG